MKIKRTIIITFAVFIIGIALTVFIFKESPASQLNTSDVNDIVQTISENWDNVVKGELPRFQYGLDYVVIDQNEELAAATDTGLNEDINSAVRNRDTIVDIKKDGIVVGKVIFYNETAALWEQYRMFLIIAYISIMAALAGICIGYAIFMNHVVIRPFNKMKKFAGNIAAGNLNVPLQMDRNNLFGAFTESFDLMREELGKARENERKANQSKKELVASLSHDIKTPLASIKAVTELMLVTIENGRDKERLETISKKTDQIETLVNNMFHATLEELQELSVNVGEIQSSEIQAFIHNADYEHKAGQYTIAQCIVLADTMRLQQVIDNIISNSYKYADTSIVVHSLIDNGYLILQFKDFGAGVSEDDLPLLFNKYYRGEKAEGKSGYGLGLYISKFLVERMDGKIKCENHSDGFEVSLALRLAGK